MPSKDKVKATDQAMAEIQKTHGKGAIMRYGEKPIERVPCIPTGAPSLDVAIGCGGYPRGRITEVYGPESSGKTTLTLHAIAECQRRDGICAFIDAEHALDMQYAVNLGVDPRQLLVSQPDHGEQALDIVETLVLSGAVDLIVVDSVAALVPKAEVEGEMGDLHVGTQARLMSQAMRKLNGIASRRSAAIMFINQLRQKIGVKFGSPETTTGGNALKYYASVRLDVRRIGAVKTGEDVLGNRTRVKVVKNKLAPPFQIAEFDIRYGEGIDLVGDLLDTAVGKGVIDKSGAHFSFRGERIGQGREKARASLLENVELRERLEKALTAGATAAPAQAA